jgi:hypothetical protein
VVAGILVGGVLFQLGFTSVENLRRIFGQRRQFDLAVEVLKTQFEMIRDLWRKRAEGALPWNGYRKFLVSKKIMECSDVCSFLPHATR